MYEKFKDYDFADAKPVSAFPHLQRLQAEGSDKTPVPLQVDTAVLAAFKARAAVHGGDYEALMNDALKRYLRVQDLEEVASSE